MTQSRRNKANGNTLLTSSAKNEDAVIHLGCSATNFPQTIFLLMVTAFACMVMTAKSESHLVVIVSESQVWISKLPISKRAKIFRSFLTFGKMLSVYFANSEKTKMDS